MVRLRSWLRSSAPLIFSAALASGLVVAVDAALGAATPKVLTLAAACAFGLGATAGALFGFVQSLLATLFARPARSFANALSLGARITRDPAAPREPVVDLHANVLAGALALAVLTAITFLMLVAFRKLQNQTLTEQLTLVAVAGAALVAALVFTVARSAIRHALARLDRRLPLPLPPSAMLQRALYVALPLITGSVGGLLGFSTALGMLSLPIWLALVCGVQLLLWPIAVWLARSTPARVVALVALPLGLLASERGLSAWLEVARTLDGRGATTLLLDFARAATDVDGDQASSLFGGRDCAPWTSSRGPWVQDIPGNGVDENCDGHDANVGDTSWPGENGPRYWDEAKRNAIGQHDVILFVVDALRADHTSLNGYKRRTTPYLDALAKESLVFTQALTQSSATLFSIPSLMTGISPGRLFWKQGKLLLQLQERHQTLAERLAAEGYFTGFVASTYFRKYMPGLFQGIEWRGYLDRAQYRSSPTATALAISFIEKARQTKRPFFLMVYLPGPHTPYVQQRMGYPVYGKSNIDRYDSEIAAIDRHIGFILEVLRQDAKRWKRTMVIVTSDHGEEFEEHGQKEHARTCHIESLHVPLLVRAPGLPAKRVNRRVGLVGIAPTVIELTGLARPETQDIDGHSLLLEAYAPQRIPETHPLYCSVRNQVKKHGTFYRRAVRSGKWTVMQELSGSGGYRIYDAASDPGEKNPLALEGEVATVAAALDAQLSRAMTGNMSIFNKVMK